MYLRAIECSGFKSFAKKTRLDFVSPVSAIVGPNGSGKSNIAEAFRFVLGEQSMKAMRGKKGEDLIWSGSDTVVRANRASVSIVFDNRSRLLGIDFNEVSLERTVFRDGASEYRINESVVRLKDITELLAQAHIGSSGHHMISQGEADRILSASAAERRGMIEDALGLRVFEYKKRDSERKLEKTQEHIKEAETQRRELVPHVKYLERQAERLRRAEDMARELGQRYARYIQGEDVRLNEEHERLMQAEAAPKKRLTELEHALVEAKKGAELDNETGAYDTQFAEHDAALRALERTRSDEERALGRIEGQLSLLAHTPTTHTDIPHREVRDILHELEAVEQTLSAPEFFARARGQLSVLIARVRALVHDVRTEETTNQKEELLAQKTEHETRIAEITRAIEERAQARTELHVAFEALRKEARDAEREVFSLLTEINQVRAQVHGMERQKEDLVRAREAYERVVADAQSYPALEPVLVERTPTYIEQQESLRAIERLLARLDEAGGVDRETLDEYERTKARVEFLEREITDLETSRVELETLIENLDTELTERFKTGVETINAEFSSFFSMLFNGGSASLKVVRPEKKKPIVDEETGEEIPALDDEEEVREGVDIAVQIPRKKVRSLDALSGGERALTSIALIFAMSQVNPPPFLILDETDAALDEANSKRYADMVRMLSAKSQLILITHNRATMSAAGELYGITMGRDGVSVVLSVKLEEAMKVAK